MSVERVQLEVTNCIRMENGNVEISSNRGRGIFAVALGLPLLIFVLWALINGAADLELFLVLIPLGGLLVYIGVRALRASVISIEVDQRRIQSLSSSSQSPQTWSFDALEYVKGLHPGGEEKKSGISLLRVSLQFKDGKSLPLFSTADVKRAYKVGQWLDAAFSSKPAE